MVVLKKRLGGASPPVKAGLLKKAVIRPTYSLPTAPKETCHNFLELAGLIYGRPGIGKTSFLASFPETLMLSCERVSKGISCFDFNAENGGVHKWEVFLAAIKLLEDTPGTFKTVGIDTIDALYNLCFAYVCKKFGIAHPQDEAYGKAWDAIKQEFAGALDRLWATGRGVIFTSHAKESEVKSHSGETYSRITPTMSNQAFGYIKAKTDYVFYAEYFRDTNGEPVRVLITSGDDLVEAKCPGGIPRFLPLDKKRGVDVVIEAFTGDDSNALDINNLRAAKQSTKAGTQFIGKIRSEAITAKVHGTGKSGDVVRKVLRKVK